MPNVSNKKIDLTVRTNLSAGASKSPAGLSNLIPVDKDPAYSRLPVTLKGLKTSPNSHKTLKKLLVKSPAKPVEIKSPSSLKSPPTTEASLIPIDESDLSNKNIIRFAEPSSEKITQTNANETLQGSGRPFKDLDGEGSLANNLSTQRVVRYEFYLSLLAGVIFTTLWIYLMMTFCYQNMDKLYWVKTFSLIGAVVSFMVAIYCFFDRQVSHNRGLAFCIFYTTLVSVGSMNLVGAYLAINCICTCGTNAVRELGEDMLIFVLEILGSMSLFFILMLVSL